MKSPFHAVQSRLTVKAEITKMRIQYVNMIYTDLKDKDYIKRHFVTKRII
jgi:hypothetical protein